MKKKVDVEVVCVKIFCMKLLFQKKKYIRYQIRKSKKSLKRRIKIKKYKKHINHLLRGKPRAQCKNIKNRIKFNYVKAPENFSLLKNVEESIRFLNKIENFFVKNKKVFVELKEVKFIDHSAITVLLSLMYKFKLSKIKFNGDFPNEEKVRKKLVNSHFFERLMKPLSLNQEYILNKENQIFARANKFVVPELGLQIMGEVSQTIWGKKRVCKGLQRTLLELMQNTNNHASNKEGEVHWWLSVNHDKHNNTVDFYFVDYGQGILKSLENKTSKKIWDGFWISFKNMIKSNREPDIIKSLLEGKHRKPEHRNNSYYRGKGLPGVMRVLNRNEISNLHIITNNVFVTTNPDNKFERMNRSFNGTFYHWQLHKNNINTLWNQ